MAVLSGNVIFEGNSINYLSSGDIYGTGYFYSNSFNENSIANANFFNSSVNSGEIINGTFQDLSTNKGTALLQALFLENATNYGVVNFGTFSGSAVNSGVVQNSGIFLETSQNKGIVSGNALFALTASNVGGTVIGSSGVFGSSSPKQWTQTSQYIEISPLNARSTPNRMAINNNADKIVLRADALTFKSFCLNLNSNGQIKTFTQIGSDISADGRMVSMNASGNRIAINNNYDSYGSNGTVKIYDLINNNWELFQQPISSNVDEIQYGRSASLNASGDKIAVGAPNYNVSNDNVNNGCVSIVCWNQQSSQWNNIGLNIVGANGEKIGASVEINGLGDKVVFSTASGFKVYCAESVLIPNSNPPAYDVSWQQIGSTIYLPDANQYQIFSSSSYNGQVSMNSIGDRILVSQFRLSDPQYQSQYLSGVVAAYCWNGNSWNQMGGLLHSQHVDDYFGWDIEMNSLGNKIIIGASMTDGEDYSYARGKASIYDWNGSNWIKTNCDLGFNNTYEANACYGQQVSISASENIAYASKFISGLNFVSRYEIL